MVFIVGLILFNTVVNAMKLAPNASATRFWTYDDPYSFSSKNITLRTNLDGSAVVQDGSSGVFMAMWTAMTTIVFSLIGFEAVSVTAGENRDLQKAESIKIATRKIGLRIILLYTLGTFTVGLNVPYTDENLQDFARNNIRSGQHSAFIVAAVINRIKFWPSLFNAFFIFSATTSGINSLYISSRILHSLAAYERAWPNLKLIHAFRLQLQHTKFGVPYYAVFTSWLMGLLAFLATERAPTIVSTIITLILLKLTVV